ncbi:pentatricopeptide repeat-containing protein At3g12770 [Cajanus cajan]|uniref:Pentatricopeptide repeat-containing protein At3g12770 family n=1 Tax=Cajanus cajan TaxID=3821 RepID=A0A151U7K7_CAJCA|nr:pentatricopeptide repeat-containing protein At3g12770 [Cajanus cajan]KYP75306.1 Pentatricopeptide repeat-containing protein At3g12770 family [Cajanus cajan]
MLSLYHQFVVPTSQKFKYSVALLHSPSWSSIADPLNLATLLQGHIPHSKLLQIHARVFLLGAHQDNLVATRLIGHYPSPIALRVFHHLQNPNIFPFNAIIRVLAQEGHFFHAVSVFNHLKRRPLFPNDLTFSFLLKACFRSKDVRYVEQIHAHIHKIGFLSNSFVCNGLVSVYAKGFKKLLSARKAFDEIPDKRVVSCWTNLITGFAQSGQSEEVLQLFHDMIRQNLLPQSDTMVSVLSACSSLEMAKIEKWVCILSELIDDGVNPRETCHDSVNTVLVYLFGKWGRIEQSREGFDRISASGKRSVVPWNAMISAYVQNGYPMEGLRLFHIMVEEQTTRPNHITIVSVLSACAQIGDLSFGSWVHEYLISLGHKDTIGSNQILATSLIDMYSKCGNLDKAKEVFEHTASKDVVLFNAMIMGLAVYGEGEDALRLFYKMPDFGLQPNAGTFLGALSACSHSGLLEKGRQIFRELTLSTTLTLEHFACYVDLLARVGCVEEAIEVVTSMPFKPNYFVWGALLGGCLLHSRGELAQEVSRRLVEVDPYSSAGYVMLANALASDSQWCEVSELRMEMKEKGIKKQPGSSWIIVDGVVHEFLVACLSHPKIEEIYHTLAGLVKHMKVAAHYQRVLLLDNL